MNGDTRCTRGDDAHHLARLRTLLDVHDKLLLLLLELRPLPVQLALRLGEGALVLPQPLGGRDCPSEEGFLCNAR